MACFEEVKECTIAKDPLELRAVHVQWLHGDGTGHICLSVCACPKAKANSCQQQQKNETKECYCMDKLCSAFEGKCWHGDFVGLLGEYCLEMERYCSSVHCQPYTSQVLLAKQKSHDVTNCIWRKPFVLCVPTNMYIFEQLKNSGYKQNQVWHNQMVTSSHIKYKGAQNEAVV